MSNEETKILNDEQPADDGQEISDVNEQPIDKELIDGDGENDDLGLVDEGGRLFDDELVSEDDWEDDDDDSDNDSDLDDDSDGLEDADQPGDNDGEQELDQDDDSDSDEDADEDSDEEEAQPEPIKRDQLTESQYYEQVTEQAKEAVKRITGEDYDEFDPKHKIILTDQATKIMQTKDAETKALSRVDEIMTQAGPGFDKFVQNTMQDLSVRKYNEILAAEQRGDYSKTLAVVEAAAEAFKGNGKRADVQQQASAKAKQLNSKKNKSSKGSPPKMIKPGAGNRSAPHSSNAGTFGLSDIGMSEDDF